MKLFKLMSATAFLLTTVGISALSNASDLLLEPLNCSKEHALRSEEAESEAIISFKNGTNENIVLRWINYDGERDNNPNQITIIKPDESTGRKSYFTHPFVVTDAVGNCLGLYISQAKNNVVFVQ